jgi:hypothetical protein
VGLWLASEKSALKEALQAGLRNLRLELETEREARKSAIDDLKAWNKGQGQKITELEKGAWTRAEQAEFKTDLVSRLDRLEAKLDKVLER